MAFRTDTTAPEIYGRSQAICRSIKNLCQQHQSRMFAGPVDAITDILVDLYLNIQSQRRSLESLDMAATVDYAKEMHNDVTYDSKTESDKVIAAINGVLTQIQIDVPENLPLHRYTGEELTERPYPPEDTVLLRAELQKVIDLIVP